MRSGVEWSGVEWSGVEWSGVEWSGKGLKWKQQRNLKPGKERRRRTVAGESQQARARPDPDPGSRRFGIRAVRRPLVTVVTVVTVAPPGFRAGRGFAQFCISCNHRYHRPDPQALQRSMRREKAAHLLLRGFLFGRTLSVLQFVKAAVYSYPWIPSASAIVSTVVEAGDAAQGAA